jgi:hypothetical protein
VWGRGPFLLWNSVSLQLDGSEADVTLKGTSMLSDRREAEGEEEGGGGTLEGIQMPLPTFPTLGANLEGRSFFDMGGGGRARTASLFDAKPVQ